MSHTKTAVNDLVRALVPASIMFAPTLYNFQNISKTQLAFRRALKKAPRAEELPPSELAPILSSMPEVDDWLKRVRHYQNHRARRLLLRGVAKGVLRSRNNAFAEIAPPLNDEEFAIIAGKRLPSAIYAHEMGHIKAEWDARRQGRTTSGWGRALSPLYALAMPVDKTPLLKNEIEAWDNAGIAPDDPLRVAALNTYRATVSGPRYSLMGLAGGLAAMHVLDPERTPFARFSKWRQSVKAAGWLGVDLDGTLAKYDGWKGVKHIGEPVPAMRARVQRWLRDGKDVRIFSARASNGAEAKAAIRTWCKKYLGKTLPITNVKDPTMDRLYDDRAVGVVANTGTLKTAGSVDAILRGVVKGVKKSGPVFRANSLLGNQNTTLAFTHVLRHPNPVFVAGDTAQRMGLSASMTKIPSQLRTSVRKLFNALTWAHEGAERQQLRINYRTDWDKQPDTLRGLGHESLLPLLREHNILSSVQPKLSPTGFPLRTLRAHFPENIAVLERTVPGLVFGQTPRLSRHAIKRIMKLPVRIAEPS